MGFLIPLQILAFLLHVGLETVTHVSHPRWTKACRHTVCTELHAYHCTFLTRYHCAIEESKRGVGRRP